MKRTGMDQRRKLLQFGAAMAVVAGAATANAEPTQIDVWVSVNPPWPQVVAAFEKLHPDIKVNLENVGETVSNSAKFVTAVAAGEGPDVLFQNRHSLSEIAALGGLRSVDDLISRDGINESQWAPVQYREMQWRGHQYGLPLDTDTRLLFWNKDIFTEVGLDPNHPPQTWQELEAVTPKLNKYDANGKMVRAALDPYRFGNTWFWLYAWQNKGQFYADADHTIATADDPRNVEALEWLTDYYDKYLGGFQASGQAISAGGGNPFVSGRLAMIGDGNWQFSYYAANAPFKWGTAPVPYPADGEKSTWSCGYSLVMPKTVKNPTAAWEFIKFATGAEGERVQLEYTKQNLTAAQANSGKQAVLFPPLTTNVQARDMILHDYLPALPVEYRDDFLLAVDSLNWTHGCGSEMAPLGLVYWNAIDEASNRAFTHQTTPKGALVDARNKVQAELDKFYGKLPSGD